MVAIAFLLLAIGCSNQHAQAMSGPEAMQQIKTAFVRAADTGLAPYNKSVPPLNAPIPIPVMIRMRDGVDLHTIYMTPGKEDKTYSTVIDRSPYGATGTELIADVFLPLGYASIEQDFRGTYKSGGKFDLWRKCYNDTYDTVQWIIRQKWSNGKIHIVGGSADGIASLVMAAHPPIEQLVSQFIIWATSEPYLSVYPGGAYRKGLIDNWLNHYIKKTNATALEEEARSHESPLDPWWNAVTPDKSYSNVKAPTVFWAGWYDIFLNGNLVSYEGWKTRTDGKSWLVIDPLGHCQDAAKQFPGAGIEGRVALAVLLGVNLFEGHLNEPGAEIPEDVKHLTFFVMGANHTKSQGNFWTTMEEFPTPMIRNYYMQLNGKLSPNTSPEGTMTFDYDPSNPVPTIGGNNLELPCGPLDQRPKEARDDVLVFTSEPLKEALPVVGKLTVTLFVSSANVNDTDWTAQLTDVYPDGTSRLIQDGILRMRWRNMGRYPEPIQPGEVTKIEIDLWTTAFVFDPGHSIRVDVSSSNYPRFLANPNTGLPLSMHSNKTIVAKNSLHMSSSWTSHIALPIVLFDDIPKHFIV